MGKRLPYTPNTIIRNALRLVFLRSRERRAALKRTSGACEVCGEKAEEVHHLDGIDWAELVSAVRVRLLPDQSRLMPLCKRCHREHHEHCPLE